MVSYLTKLPTDEELQVPHEIEMSTPALRASAIQMATYCEDSSKEYMLCRKEEEDPRKCLREGRDVTQCGIKFLQLVKKFCLDEFQAYAHCIDYNHEMCKVGPCIKQCKPFDKCILDNVGQERPILGYFMIPKAVNSARPVPEAKGRDYKAEAAALKRDSLEDAGEINQDARRYSQYDQRLSDGMDGIFSA